MNHALATTLLTVIAALSSRAADPPVPDFYAARYYGYLNSQGTIVGDFNGDGIPDLLAIDEGALYVLFGNGDGTFRAGPTSSFLEAGVHAVASDLDRDSKLDLVLSANNSSQVGGVLVALGAGNGRFPQGTFYPAGSEYYGTTGAGVVVGDFTGDGIPDIALTSADGVWLYRGNGDGTFEAAILAVSVSNAWGLATADFNGDGIPDLVVGTTPAFQQVGEGVYVVLGNGNGTFGAPKHFPLPSVPRSLTAGKLGPNGHSGFAVGSENGELTAVYFGDGTGNFSGPHYLDMPGNAVINGLAIGDVNGDGIPDVVSGSTEAYIAFGTAAGGFTKPVAYPIESGGGVWTLTVADLRNNGRLDIVSDSEYEVSVLLNQGKGTYEDGVFTKLASGAGCGVSADFNRDGKPDLAVNTAAGISVLLGTGKALEPFTAGESIALSGADCLSVSGDLNGDGIPDLILSAPAGVLAYLGNGDGTFTLKSTTPISGASYLVLADFNRDGILDFATSGNQFALGNGDGTFQTPQLIQTVGTLPFDYTNVAVGDINNDGWPDVVLTNYYGANSPWFVGLNNHQGGFTSVPQTEGAETADVELADLNGDGNLDILSDGSIYLGDGKGDFVFKESLNISVLEGASFFGIVQDVNGDGIPDVVMLGESYAEVYLGNGDGTFGTPFFLGAGPSPGSVLTANLHGQNPKAGLPDIVLPDETGGVMVLPNLTK